ncbi:hypothetical protein LV779_13675 [Streptomyces thinghirensis]|nr:hypothetical protein [Streptomyces thinghirensis]
MAFQTLRARWVSFLGTVVALVLGVAQVAAMGLLVTTAFDLPDRPVERFAGAGTVVRPQSDGWNPAHHDLGVRSPRGGPRPRAPNCATGSPRPARRSSTAPSTHSCAAAPRTRSGTPGRWPASAATASPTVPRRRRTGRSWSPPTGPAPATR